MHKKLKWSKKTQKPVDVIAEQYIPLPLAIADNDGMPIKGNKSFTTKALKSRYKETPVVTSQLPPKWTPDCCIIEGTFMLNTSPINGTTFSDYAKFLMNRYIKPEFTRGAQEVHLIFDNPGRLKETPKHFERQRRDQSATIQTNNTCESIHAAQKLPYQWREDLINCRTCKRNLVIFL